jgi:type III restriction enzyme
VEKKNDMEAKVATVHPLCVPAVNNSGDYGRWAFLEIRDPWNAMNAIRGFLKDSIADAVTNCDRM